MKFTALVYLLFAALAGCAANGLVDQINMICARLPNHTIETKGNCTACYHEKKSVLACVAEEE